MAKARLFKEPHYFGVKMEKSLWQEICGLAMFRKKTPSEFARECLEEAVKKAEIKKT